MTSSSSGSHIPVMLLGPSQAYSPVTLGSAGRNQAEMTASHWPLRHRCVQAALSRVSNLTSIPTSRSWAWMTWATAIRSVEPARLSMVKAKRRPLFMRTPSGPSRHPASSSIRRAASGSYSTAGVSALW